MFRAVVKEGEVKRSRGGGQHDGAKHWRRVDLREPQEGRQEDASLTACGPVSVAVGQAGFLLACGVGLSDTSHDHCLGGFVWCHVGPEVHAHTHPKTLPIHTPPAVPECRGLLH
jgi:hypothetical protein